MVGWHHRLDGTEFEQGLRVGNGSLMCCSPWGCKELDTTEWLNWTELMSDSYNRTAESTTHWKQLSSNKIIKIKGSFLYVFLKKKPLSFPTYLICWPDRIIRVPHIFLSYTEPIVSQPRPDRWDGGSALPCRQRTVSSYPSGLQKLGSRKTVLPNKEQLFTHSNNPLCQNSGQCFIAHITTKLDKIKQIKKITLG